LPFIAPRKASPSPSPSPHLVWPLPSTPQANHDPQVDASANKHSWRSYGLVIAGSSVFLVMAAAFVVYCRAKKVGTVKPWVTGLSGQLQRAFVTGILLSICVYLYHMASTSVAPYNMINHVSRCTILETVRAGSSL
jgi:hypothetical protein